MKISIVTEVNFVTVKLFHFLSARFLSPSYLLSLASRCHELIYTLVIIRSHEPQALGTLWGIHPLYWFKSHIPGASRFVLQSASLSRRLSRGHRSLTRRQQRSLMGLRWVAWPWKADIETEPWDVQARVAGVHTDFNLCMHKNVIMSKTPLYSLGCETKSNPHDHQFTVYTHATCQLKEEGSYELPPEQGP